MANETAEAVGAPEESVVPDRAKLVLLTLVLVAAVANLNLAVANVALPDIGNSFDASQTALDLVAVGYSLGLAASVLYRDPVSKRIWYVSTLPFSLRGERLRGVQVREMGKDGKLTRVIHADSAMWWPGGVWRFYDGKEVLYAEGQPTALRPFPKERLCWD